MQPCPWSKNQLKKLSRHIRDDTDPPAGLPTYGEVMLWYNEVAAEVQGKIAALDWTPLLQDREFEVTSRSKTIDTLRQKLRRERSTPLPSVQDVAGVRFEAEMSLDEQDAVATAIAGMFEHDLEECTHDLRDAPHSGYRAVHVWLRLECRVEVQIRTHLQGSWANAYESAADLFGRSIRYDALPDNKSAREIVIGLRRVSTGRIAPMEQDRNEIEILNLQIDEHHRQFGEADDDEFVETRARLKEVKTRFKSNELELQRDLQELRESFDMVRDIGKV